MLSLSLQFKYTGVKSIFDRTMVLLIYWRSFFTKKIIVFKWEQIKIKISLCFCFASTDSLKAVTGCFEKLEISAKGFGLKLN